MEMSDLPKKDFIAMFKGHVKAVMKKKKLKKLSKESPEGEAEFAEFQVQFNDYIKFVKTIYSDCTIYMNEDQNPDGAYVVGWWNPNAAVKTAPQMMFWLSGCDFRKM